MRVKCTLWQPTVLDPNTHVASYFQACSHHPIDNIFHELEIGENKFNLHLATPGECLHMHQLGSAERAVKSIKYFVVGSFSISFCIREKELKPSYQWVKLHKVMELLSSEIWIETSHALNSPHLF